MRYDNKLFKLTDQYQISEYPFGPMFNLDQWSAFTCKYLNHDNCLIVFYTLFCSSFSIYKFQILRKNAKFTQHLETKQYTSFPPNVKS